MSNCIPGMNCWENTSNNNGCNPPVFTWFPCGCVPFTVNSTNVIYTGDNLPNSLINTNDNLTLALAKIDSAIVGIGGGVPLTRTITINGLTQDLSADRTWNTITLNSFSSGSGISYNNSTGVITNSAPDQTVTLTQGANITITGTYPNFTIASSGGASGIVVGSTTISSGTSGRIPFNNAGVYGEDANLVWDIANGALNINKILGGIPFINQGFSARHADFQISNNSSSMDTPLRVSHYSSNGGIGTGVSIEYGSTAASGHEKIGGQVGVSCSNSGIGTESFDFIISLMNGGAAVTESFRALSTGDINLGGSSLGGVTRTLLAVGSGSNIGINIFAKGTGTLNFATNGSASFSGVIQTNIGGVNVSSGSPLDNNFKGNNATGTAIAAGRAVLTGGVSSISGVPGGDVIVTGGTAGTGNANGGNTFITSGAGSGSGTPGIVALQINNITALSVDPNLNISPGAGTTSMNNGFIFIPAALGPPSGTPAALSNVVPMYYDKTNNNFYIYNGAWKKVTLT